jgi:hypothetical protein
MGTGINAKGGVSRLKLTLVSAALAMCAGFAVQPAVAGASQWGVDQGGSLQSALVMPPKAEPHGYSLADVAALTAAFNVTDHSGPLPSAVDSSTGARLQMIYTKPNTEVSVFNVRHGTTLYVPVWYNDDSPPVIGNFPNLANRQAVLRYVYGHRQMGVEYSIISVDGQDVPLNEDYLTALKVPPLPDGGGTGYMTVAAFVKHLKRGQHTIEIRSSFTGQALEPWCKIVGFCTDSVSYATKYVVNVD